MCEKERKREREREKERVSAVNCVIANHIQLAAALHHLLHTKEQRSIYIWNSETKREIERERERENEREGER